MINIIEGALDNNLTSELEFFDIIRRIFYFIDVNIMNLKKNLMRIRIEMNKTREKK